MAPRTDRMAARFRPLLPFALTVCPWLVVPSTMAALAPARAAPRASAAAPLYDLAARLEPLRAKYDLPALGAAVIVKNRLVALGATGVRKLGGDVAVTRDDQFHMGSCTKAMTATLVAMVVERKKLRWDSTVAEVFPDWSDAMDPAYRTVTIKQLLAHRSGLAGESWPKGKTFLDVHRLDGPPREQREAYLKMMLGQPPEAPPGTKYIYSNAGYALLGAMAERVMDQPWRSLMRTMLFEPLGMTSAGFGAMGSPGKIDQPWPHGDSGKGLEPIEPGPLADNPPAMGPAGTVHCSLADWAKFVIAHLEAGRKGRRLLKASTFRKLHSPSFGGDYASGWIARKRPWGGGRVFTHAGSNNANFCVVWMAPQKRFAVLVATNCAGGDTAKACDEAVWMLIQSYLLDRTKP